MNRIIETEKLAVNQYKDIKETSPLRCGKCKEVLAFPYIYKRERRNAYRVLPGMIKRKVMNPKDL